MTTTPSEYQTLPADFLSDLKAMQRKTDALV